MCKKKITKTAGDIGIDTAKIGIVWYGVGAVGSDVTTTAAGLVIDKALGNILNK
ncbi:hypothetical protein [Selenomonas sp. FC4001]|uniref:hypothetical protein n=1 Tax=Selenomonas sp. FC4001 TaxID=1408313 RepID=UPI000A65A310|nr:hypothetical protein [Selenomonas sp. FC4001]